MDSFANESPLNPDEPISVAAGQHFDPIPGKVYVMENAGKPISTDIALPLYPFIEENAKYHPFKTSNDYHFALHNLQHGVSYGYIADILKKSPYSWKNIDQYKNTLKEIKWDLDFDHWKKGYVSFEVKPTKGEDSIKKPKTNAPIPQVYYYRDLIEIIKFLVMHLSWLGDMSWGPERIYDANGNQVFGDMVTGNWWWDSQVRKIR